MDNVVASPTRRSRASRKRADREPETVTAPVVEEKDVDSTSAPEPHPELDALIGTYNGLKTMTVDAAAARRLLAINTGNRRVSQRRIGQLAAQMRGGHYENTGEPIIVSDNGVLNNGQHRLLAVIEADAAVEMDIRFGIPRKAFVKTDTSPAAAPTSFRFAMSLVRLRSRWRFGC